MQAPGVIAYGLPIYESSVYSVIVERVTYAVLLLWAVNIALLYAAWTAFIRVRREGTMPSG